MFPSFLRHPVFGRASSSFIICGSADVASQLFLKTPAVVDPDRTVRFSLAGSLSVVPVFFAWNKLLGAPVNDLQSLSRRIAMEAFLLGPMYLCSVLWWSSALRTQNPVEAFNCVKTAAFPLYLDALKVVPAYNAFTYYAIAPHMRGYALMCFQFIWNVYVSWYSDAFSADPPTGQNLLELA